LPIATLTSSPTQTAELPEPTSTATAVACRGDCDGDSQVTVDEIVKLVNLGLNGGTSICAAGDANLDGVITVDEIIRAVNNALTGCP